MDYKGAVGVGADLEVEGVDIIDSRFDFTISVLMVDADVTLGYLQSLRAAQGKVNSVPYTVTVGGLPWQFAAGELLRLVKGQANSLSSSLNKLTIGDGIRPGTLLLDSGYYRLTATDLYGRTWTSRRLHVDHERAACETVICSDLQEIACEEPSPFLQERLTLSFRSDAKIPCNSGTETLTKTAHGERSPAPWNTACVEFGPCKLVLEREDSALVATLTCKQAPLPPYIETRVVESLQLVTARTLSWASVQRSTRTVTATCLQPSGKEQRAMLNPPIARQCDPRGRWVYATHHKASAGV